MQKNQYFTPEIEDIRVGYECEIATPVNPNFESYVWDYVTLSKHNFNHESPLFALSAKLRVPYLTKEQIEVEGWIKYDRFVNLDKQEKDRRFFYKKGDFIIIFTGDLEIHKLKDYSDTNSEVLYKGECKDINTFRYISKLLKIN